jgi:aldehyde:ferredoxin oxidoreductase
LVHDAANGAGQGGFGAVLGSKNLKAVSVIGTGGLEIDDPNALIEARLHQAENYQFNMYDIKDSLIVLDFQSAPNAAGTEGQRPQACTGCHSGCRHRFESGINNEASCYEGLFPKADTINLWGINVCEIFRGGPYMRDLYEMGVLGPGKEIDCLDLDFEDYGSDAFYNRLCEIMATREGDFGDAIAEGFYRAAVRWGRAEEDLASGLLLYTYWGLPEHGYDPRTELEWGYGSILGDRDINEHDFNVIYWDATNASLYGAQPQATAEETVQIVTDKMVPFEGDMLMLDYSDENMYSEHMAKLVAWHRRYTRFWKQSVMYCDWRWTDFINLNQPDKIGSTGISEQKFLNAVTGKNLTFADGIELGRKIWNLDHAIWTLQGRHRDMVYYADYIYNYTYAEVSGGLSPIYLEPGLVNGEWEFIETINRKLDRDKFDEFKTHFYTLEGWNTETGYPERATLEGLGLAAVADDLAAVNKLGDGSAGGDGDDDACFIQTII